MFKPPHPGAGIKEELDYLGLTVMQGAKALGVNRSQLYRVISAESAISPEMALRLEKVIGGRADHWLRLQVAYDLAELRSQSLPALQALKPIEARPAV